jgi:hypothetical protein
LCVGQSCHLNFQACKAHITFLMLKFWKFANLNSSLDNNMNNKSSQMGSKTWVDWEHYHRGDSSLWKFNHLKYLWCFNLKP